MKRTTPILMLVLMLLLTAWVMPATAEANPTLLTLYEGPKTMTTSATAKVTATGNDLFDPGVAVLDPLTTMSLPERQTINGVVDSFVHVCEQYITVCSRGVIGRG